MKLRIFYRSVSLRMLLVAGAFASLSLSGCSTMTQTRPDERDEDPSLAAEDTPERKGGAQLWSERCTQCHYARDPGTFSQQQWEIIMLHMRVRANLTAAEHKAILEFFRSTN